MQNRFRKILVCALVYIITRIELHKPHGVSMDGTVEQRLVQIWKGGMETAGDIYNTLTAETTVHQTNGQLPLYIRGLRVDMVNILYIAMT
jgi:hypothetical protein